MNPYETPEETKLRIAARKTPAGRLLTRAGYDYWDTEGAARRVAEHAAGEIEELVEALKTLDERCNMFPNAEYHLAARAVIAKYTQP